MPTYAKVLNGTVTQVIVANPEFFKTFVDSSPGEWIETSYNTAAGQHPNDTPRRKNYAGIGYTYDHARDAFIPPKPSDDCTLDETTGTWVNPTQTPLTPNY